MATNVILETEWVLRAGYNFAPDVIATGLRAIGGLPGMTLDEPLEVAKALDWLGQGIDFADALHLAKSGQCSAFVTFDRKLAKRANGIAWYQSRFPDVQLAAGSGLAPTGSAPKATPSFLRTLAGLIGFAGGSAALAGLRPRPNPSASCLRRSAYSGATIG